MDVLILLYIFLVESDLKRNIKLYIFRMEEKIWYKVIKRNYSENIF